MGQIQSGINNLIGSAAAGSVAVGNAKEKAVKGALGVIGEKLEAEDAYKELLKKTNDSYSKRRAKASLENLKIQAAAKKEQLDRINKVFNKGVAFDKSIENAYKAEKIEYDKAKKAEKKVAANKKIQDEIFSKETVTSKDLEKFIKAGGKVSYGAK